MSRSQKLTSEFLGTLALILFSAGAASADQVLLASNQPRLGLIGLALAYGFSYGAMVTAAGHFSEAQFNPAVTVGRWVTRKLSTFQMVTCCAAQLGGATAGAYLLRAAVPEDVWRAAALGTPDLATGLTRTPGMLIEGLATFFLVFVVLATARETDGAPRGAGGSPRAACGVAAGLVATAGVLFAGPFTGAAMNPARAFGPALASRHWANHGVYWVGPLAGGILAAWIYDSVFARNNNPAN